ncbi:hypothetical protein IAD21_04689 [Abditibacteriota bacterium]|nr:hypothetical protein IAD21_04689 [Abditibacteriota bacterium]
MNLTRRLTFVALSSLVVALFFAARRASEIRPRRLATIPFCNELVFSSNGQLLIGKSNVSGVQTYSFLDIQNSMPVAERHIDHYQFQPLLSPDEKQIARATEFPEPPPHQSPFGFSTPTFFVSDITSDKERRFSDPIVHDDDEGDSPSVQSAVWTRDGRELIVAGKRQIRRFDAQSGQLLSRATFAPLPKLRKGRKPPTDNGAQKLAISPDGRQFLRLDSPSRLTIRDTKTARVVRSITLVGNTGPYVRFGWSEGSHFVWAEIVGVGIFSASTGRFLWRWSDMTQPHFSPDEKFVVCCNGYQCMARDAQTGRELWRVYSPNSPNFALSPDGKTLAEARSNGQIFLWPMPQRS